MTEEYVEEDNMKVLLTDYSNSLATTAISKYFDEDFNSNSTLKLNASVMKNYLSKVILMFKNKFLKQCDW